MNPEYQYVLPEELIANTPRDVRTDARLFVYDTKTNQTHHTYVRDLAQYIPQPSVLVLNDTKVLPARLHLKKETGGKIEVLVLTNIWNGNDERVPVIVDRKITHGQKLFFPDGASLTVCDQEEQTFYVHTSFPVTMLYEYLEKYGNTPLPHYIHTLLSEEESRVKYQTVYAEKKGSIAAPTASLHFTTELLQELVEKGVAQAHITLHVGMGTFAPLTQDNIEKKQLHTEVYAVSQGAADVIRRAKKSNVPVIAVGTTTTRTLETVAQRNNGEVRDEQGSTHIFIQPGFDFKVLDGLMTNFHLPNTSLMYLVQAFLQHKGAKRHVRELYEEAIQHKFRFYSFGDSMLIL